MVIKSKRDLIVTKSYRDSITRIEWDKQKNLLPIHTDQKLQKRALNFMNSFLFNMEKRGMKIEFEYGRCNVELYNQLIEINLRQKYYRVRTVDDKGWSSQKYVKSDKLEFLTEYHARKAWIDSEKRKVEELIPQILDYIEKDLTYWRDLRKRQAIEEEKKALELQKQQKLLLKQQKESERQQKLFSDATNWVKANELRAYINAKKHKVVSENIVDQQFADWEQWASKVADDLDPLE